MGQLTQLFTSLSKTQRISIVLAAVLAGAGVILFSRWRRESDFRPLYTSMSLEDASATVQKLRESGVDFRLADNGSTVLVASAKLAESRLALAAAGLPKTGRIGFELFDKSNFGATDFVEHINYKRALEGELERTMMSLAEIEQARVHLTMAKDSVFLEKQQPAKASVILKLRPGARISQPNVLAITNLVASAVEGLGPESVSIVDMNGALLRKPSRPEEMDGSQVTAGSLELRQQIERELVAKIQNTLEPVIGPDRFRASASVDCDLTSGEQQEETFDPSHSVMASSQKTEDVTEHGSTASGIPGTASNLPGGVVPTHSPASGGVSRRTENVSFQSSRIVRRTRIPQGVVRRMSLSVLVNNSVRWEGEGSARHKILEPPPPETMKSIKDLVAAATGFNAERGDQLIVESLAFESAVNAEPPAGAPSKPLAAPVAGPNWNVFLKNNGVGLVGLAVGATFLFLLIGAFVRSALRRTPTTSVEAPAALTAGVREPTLQPSAEVSSRLSANEPIPIAAPVDDSAEVAARVRQMTEKEVSVAANIIRLWLHENHTK